MPRLVKIARKINSRAHTWPVASRQDLGTRQDWQTQPPVWKKSGGGSDRTYGLIDVKRSRRRKDGIFDSRADGSAMLCKVTVLTVVTD